MCKIAIHQPNFVPWFPYFYKMAKCDKFIILSNVQFEKNNFQNRFRYKDKWVTNPVEKKTKNICNKQYTNGNSVLNTNLLWILAIKETLSIDTEVVMDFPTVLKKTERLIELIKSYDGTCYVTSPQASKKYLDEDLMKKEGIDIEYCECPPHYKMSMFEAIEKCGLEKLRKLLCKA